MRRSRYTETTLRCSAVALALVGAIRVCAGRVVDDRTVCLKAQQLFRRLRKRNPNYNKGVIAGPAGQEV